MASDTHNCEQIFACTRCGDCCRGYGGTYLSAADIVSIADYLSVDTDIFVSDFCTPSGSRLLLRQRPDGYCIFWDKLCTIHAVKPRMCRQWPYLKSVLVDDINWHSMASMCPGIRTDAPMDQVRACIEAFIASEPGGSPKR
jgi:Fe-S-cluster containining protein